MRGVFARACLELQSSGAALAASLEEAVTAARCAVAMHERVTAELRDQALAAIREREAAQALKTRRMAECAAREARKEERELQEANQA